MTPVIVALDFPDMGQALAAAETTAPHVGGFKVGLELLMGEGPSAVSVIARLGLPVFADVKFHDIPNTVKGAVGRLASYGARWATVHATGGTAMMAAAVEGASGSGMGILAVTVMTSLDSDDLGSVGLAGPPESLVASLAALAASSGTEGVVCSPLDVGAAKSAAPGLIAVTPGVRLADGGAHDQKRTATPGQALEAGADWLVVGRAITGAADMGEAAARIARSLEPEA